MTQLAAPPLASGASMATVIAAFVKFGASTVAVVNAAVEGGAASNPNIAPTTVDRTNMRSNASVGVYAAEAGASGFVVTEAGVKGLQYVSASGFTATYSAGTAWVRKTSVSPDDTVRVTKATTWNVTLTATSDNYVYIKADASVAVATASVGGSAPTLPADSLLLSVATTDGSSVTGTPVDMGPSNGIASPKNYRSVGCWPKPTSTTVFTLPPGTFEVDGLTVTNTANQSLNIGTVTFLSGARTSAASIFFYAGNNGGSVKYGLSTSAPSAVTVVAGATSGTVGLKQYRTIGALAYRCLGSCRTSTTAVLKQYDRLGPETTMWKGVAALSGGTATNFTAVNLTTMIPPTAKMAKVIASLAGTADTLTLRMGSTAATGIQYVNAGSQTEEWATYVPVSTNGLIEYKTGGQAATVTVIGYREGLD